MGEVGGGSYRSRLMWGWGGGSQRRLMGKVMGEGDGENDGEG